MGVLVVLLNWASVLLAFDLRNLWWQGFTSGKICWLLIGVVTRLTSLGVEQGFVSGRLFAVPLVVIQMLVWLDLNGHMRLTLGIAQGINAGLAFQHVRAVATNAVAHRVAFVLQGFFKLLLSLLPLVKFGGLLFGGSNTERLAVRPKQTLHPVVLFKHRAFGYFWLWHFQLDPPIALWVFLVSGEALLVLDGGLAHLDCHLLVVLGGAAYCLLHADLVQLVGTDAPFHNVLLEDIDDMVKPHVGCVACI